jgi:hypothetical protein
MPKQSSSVPWGRWGSGLLLFGLVVQACSGESERPIDVHVDMPGGARPGNAGEAGSETGGTGGAGGTGGTGGTGADGGTGGEDALAPLVEITFPAEPTSPNDEGVILDTEIDVVCTVKPGSSRATSEIAPETVFVQLLDAEGEPIVINEGTRSTAIAATATGKADEYSAHVILNNVVDNGPIGFTCSASDESAPPLTGTDSVNTFVDFGPAITPIDPVPDSAHPLIGALRVAFTVEAFPLSDDDDGAGIDEVTLEVGGIPFELDEVDGEYSASVALDDTALFPSTPVGAFPIAITATNRRSPTPATRVSNYTFLVDGEGPKITITSPAAGAVVGGRVPLVFEVVDPLSGVNDNSVVVKINNVEHPFGQGGDWSVVGSTFTFKFDSTQIEFSQAQATINIRASDFAGNESKGKSWQLYLDNLAPIVDLDPGHVRAYKEVGDTNACSSDFDPLGSAKSDLEVCSVAALLRALVWERTNQANGQTILWHSGTVEDSVRLYIQPDPSKPFLVNSTDDPDPDCDDLDEAALSDLEFTELKPLARAGAAYFSADNEGDPPISDFKAGCVLEAATSPPPPLCSDELSDMSFVMGHTMEGRPPVVYALDPIPSSIACTGQTWEIGAHADEGWVCLAGRALDNAGNIGISRPLRLCYDNPDTSFVPDCSEPPECTDGCTLPPAFPEAVGDAFTKQ